MRRCRHCRRRPANRARSLCWVCFNVPGVREHYVPRSKNGRRGVDHLGRVRRPAVPTQARPGSPEKVAVLTQRASLGQELWHPDDAVIVPRRRRAG